MKVDGSILVDDPMDAGPLAGRLQAAGYAGAFTFEGRHDPFLPLCCICFCPFGNYIHFCCFVRCFHDPATNCL